VEIQPMSRLFQLARCLYHKLLGTDSLTLLRKRGLVVGEDLDMLDSAVIDSSHCWLITIGDHVTLAPRVHILAHDASMRSLWATPRLAK
jgi:maltose O-acetyltransferase